MARGVIKIQASPMLGIRPHQRKPFFILFSKMVTRQYTIQKSGLAAYCIDVWLAK